ncbi:class I SAM-dependent methyltransferase [Nonomuraea sp. NPDC049152]|uniref:class I SAM-dependent methyltransferase n=1 Tax=Nonomuraea sp. NPDC049152 TaxID=3154350 RepID=UPI003400C3EE
MSLSLTSVPTFPPIQETLFLTLYCRALDSRLPASILRDTMSDDLARRLDYDFTRIKSSPSLISGTALRARKLDEAVNAFCAAHPHGVVLDLGCGLDTRAFRCERPEGVDWYDIDLPDVIGLRAKVIPHGDRIHPVAADLAEPGWRDAIPGGRPAMIVAEGVLPFLPGATFQAMIRRLTGHFPEGMLALNGYTRFAAWSMRFHPAMKALGIRGAEGFDDAREPEGWGAGLTLAGEQLLSRAPEVASFPQPLRALTRLMARSDALSRQGARVLCYRFPVP